MFIKKSTYQLEQLIAKQRIEYLEKKICPNGHSYKEVWTNEKGTFYTCSNCGKLVDEVEKQDENLYC